MTKNTCLFLFCMYLFVPYCNAESSTSLLIRKCCPESQQLDWRLNECVEMSHQNGSDIKQRNTVDFLEFPWWLSGELTDIDSLFGNSSLYHVEFGPKPPCEFDNTAVLNSNETLHYSLSSNGSLIYRTHAGNDVSFRPESYCADRVMENDTSYHHVFLLCPCLHSNCVKKCCAYDEMMLIGDKSECVVREGNITWSLPAGGNLTNEEVQSEHYLFNCSSVQEFELVNVWMLRNGSVLTGLDGDDFCGEKAVLHGGTTTVVRCSFQELPKGSEKKNKEELSTIIYPLSATFLIITLVVFSLVPETRNTKSNIVICHIISLLAIYILRTTGRRPDNGVFTDAECYTLFFLHHFFYLSASFWITALCLDIACTFRVFRPTQGAVHVVKQKRRFYWYSLGCWGGPALFLVVIAIMEFTPGIPDYHIKPGIAEGFCGIWGYDRVWVYFHGPQMVLSLINSVLLLFTLVKISKAHCSMTMLDSEDSAKIDNSNSNSCMRGRKRYIVYINLLCLMGPPRLVSIIHWAVSDDWDLVIYLDYVGDILRAVSLMLFVCCKPGIPQLFLQRLREIGSMFTSCCRRRKPHPNPKITLSELKDKDSSGVTEESSCLSNNSETS